MKEKRNKLPEISSLRELADFWDDHDLADYQDEFVEVSNLKMKIEGRTYLPITVQMYEKLDEIAKTRGMQVDKLIRQFLEEKIAELG